MIGRIEETRMLQSLLHEEEPQFVAVFGRNENSIVDDIYQSFTSRERLIFYAQEQEVSERYCNCFFIERFHLADKSCKTFPVIRFVRTKDTGEVFLTVEGDPDELPAVVV